MPRMQPKTPTHKCAARRCTIYVKRSMLLCGEHWRATPPHLKQALEVAFSDRNRDPRAPVTQAYADAMTAIITYLDRLETTQQQSELDATYMTQQPDDDTLAADLFEQTRRNRS